MKFNVKTPSTVDVSLEETSSGDVILTIDGITVGWFSEGCGYFELMNLLSREVEILTRKGFELEKKNGKGLPFLKVVK